MKLNLRAFCRATSFCLTIFAAVATAGSARARQDNTVTARHSASPKLVFADADVYIVGEPARICDGTTRVYPDPRGRYALIARTDAEPPDDPFGAGAKAKAEPSSTSLLLYDSQTDRTKTVWRHGASAAETAYTLEVSWLAGRDVALVAVGTPAMDVGKDDVGLPPTPDYWLLEINPGAMAGIAPRTLWHGHGILSVSASPKQPMALLAERFKINETDPPWEVGFHYRTLNAAGVIGPVIPISPTAVGPFSWNENGDTGYLVDRRSSATVAPTNAPGQPDASTPPPPRAPKIQWFAVSIETRQVTLLDKKPAAIMQPNGGAGSVAARLSVHLTNEPVSVGPQPTTVPTVLPRATAKLWPLWLQTVGTPTAGDHHPTAALLAADMDEATLLPDASAVLYTSAGALYAVPLTRKSRVAFDVPYRAYLRQLTISNAKRIGLAMLQYSIDSDAHFPPVGDLIKGIGPYLQDERVLNNAETGQLGFLYLLNGDTLSGIANPAAKAVGYLAGPGGRAVIYVDGHVIWQPDTPGGD